MFVCILTALLWAQLTADKYGGCQKCSGTEKHQDRPPWFFPSWVTLQVREWRTRTGVEKWGRTALHLCKKAGTDPITYLERVTTHFAVLWFHVAEAAMPTQGGPFTTAGEAFWPNCSGQRSVQRYLKWNKQGKAIPFPSSLPWTACQGGVLSARPLHPPTPGTRTSRSTPAIPCEPHACVERLSSRLFLSAPNVDEQHALN